MGKSDKNAYRVSPAELKEDDFILELKEFAKTSVGVIIDTPENRKTIAANKNEDVYDDSKILLIKI